MTGKEKCMGLILYVMRVNGLWPSTDDRVSWRTQLERAVSAVVMVIRFVYVMSMTHVYRDWDNQEAIFDSTSKLCTSLPLFVMANVVFAKRRELEDVIGELRRLFDEDVFSIAQRPLYQDRQIIKIHFAFICLVIFVYCSMPLYGLVNAEDLHDVPFQVDAWFPLERDSYYNFFIEYGYQVFCITLTAMLVTLLHGLCLSLMLHIGSLYDMVAAMTLMFTAPGTEEVKDAIVCQEVAEDTARDGKLVSRGKQREQDPHKVIIFHQKVLKLSEEVRNLLDPFLFSFFVVSSLSMCLIVYNIATMEATNPRMIMCIVHLVFTVAAIGLFCFYGIRITEKSAQVNDIAYATDCMLSSQSFKRSLLMIMIRSQKLVYITAGMFGVLSFSTFSGILEAGYSYFTVLKNLGQE